MERGAWASRVLLPHPLLPLPHAPRRPNPKGIELAPWGVEGYPQLEELIRTNGVVGARAARASRVLGPLLAWAPPHAT